MWQGADARGGGAGQSLYSMLSAMRVLHPDGYAELRRWGEANQGPMPQAAHLNRATFMHVIGADETGHIRRGSAADASGHRFHCSTSTPAVWSITAPLVPDVIYCIPSSEPISTFRKKML